MGVRSGPVSSRQNEKRNSLQREMFVKDKGEREKCGSEASGLTAGKGEREGRISGLKELHRGSARLVKQRSPVQAKITCSRSPALGPNVPVLALLYPAPHHTHTHTLLTHWLGAPWGEQGLGVNTAADPKDLEAVRPTPHRKSSGTEL